MHGKAVFFLALHRKVISGIALHLHYISVRLDRTGAFTLQSSMHVSLPTGQKKKDFLGDLRLFKLHFLLLCEISFRLAARKQSLTDHRNNLLWDRFPNVCGHVPALMGWEASHSTACLPCIAADPQLALWNSLKVSFTLGFSACILSVWVVIMKISMEILAGVALTTYSPYLFFLGSL